ncbi:MULTISPECIES: ABC transporter ATP-binding protein [unclassified Pseudonocardia]|uniref:ABC transporter ATP-binding protein n=1 Tax=unclassified Pseudonocardia TaxID=2619320 RepID=UPI0001FFE4BB|nr:ABC transporter ATP-binding protein [Pseudonocardia sp. Ae707_Ps1]OLM16731.1 Methionine ABC transporter ATP-binding protein [Pseudonocardia sp. Ae707_Ps1]
MNADDLTRPLPRITADPAGVGTRAGREPTIELRDVHKSFGDFAVLRGVTASFADNSITTMLGPSGTGKSVLLKHIVGLLEPDAGEIRVFGQDIWAMNEKERADLRKNFGLLFQDGALFGSMNIYDNVAFPLRRHTRMRETEIRDLVMHHLSELGLEQAVDRSPGEVSGGMRKRAGFARALVMKPKIVMFDEPDSGLDPVRTQLLCELIKKLHDEYGGTYVVITHDMETARALSDDIGLLWHGKVVHFGPAGEAFTSDDPFVRQFLNRRTDGPLGMD